MCISTLEDGVEKALTRLKEGHAVIAHLLERDKLDLEEANANTLCVKRTLRNANPHEDWTDRPTPTLTGEVASSMHPMLGRLNIPQAHQAALEDFGDCIQSTQMDQEMASANSTSIGPAIPFLPQRTVEVRLNARLHRTWCLNNINLLAPIPISVWKI